MQKLLFLGFLVIIHCEIIAFVPENCVEINFQYKCEACKDGYKVDRQNNLCIMTTDDDQTQQAAVVIIQTTEQSTTTSIDTSAPVSVAPMSALDLNCKIKNADNSCQQCYSGFYYDSIQEGRCVPVNPQCKQSNKLGHCTDCYDGYTVLGTLCIIQSQIIQSQEDYTTDLKDQNCAQFSEDDDNYCMRCSYRYQFNQNNICTLVSPNCQSWNKQRHCITCYPGFDLVDTKCLQKQVILPQQQTFIPTKNENQCIQYKQQQQDISICIKCAFRFVLIDNFCYSVSDQCRTWNQLALCDSCYDGYDLTQDGQCISMAVQTQVPTTAYKSITDDEYCRLRAEDGSCKQCSFRYYLRTNGYCSAVSNLCRSWNTETGLCTKCYDGYLYENGVCFLPDPYCNIRSAIYGCVQCFDRYYLNVEGICAQVSATCDQYNVFTGDCESCYDNYEVRDGNCLVKQDSQKQQGN